MLRYAGCAVRLNVGPVMPGAAANATCAKNSVAATASARRSCVSNVAFFMFFGLIAALLIAGITERTAASDAIADVDLGHHSAEVLCIVGQVVQLGSVDIERAARWIEFCR